MNDNYHKLSPHQEKNCLNIGVFFIGYYFQMGSLTPKLHSNKVKIGHLAKIAKHKVDFSIRKFSTFQGPPN